MTANDTPDGSASEIGGHRPMKSRLGRPPKLNRTAVLDATRGVVARRGLQRTRYSDVAEAAGVPVTTLQHSFGSLSAMLMESVQRSTANEIAILRELSHDTSLTPWQRLTEFIAGAVSPPDEPDSWLLWIELWSLAGRDPEIGASCGVIYAQWWEYVEELIRLGTEAGEFTGPLVSNPRDAAVAVVSIIDGAAIALMVRADGPDADRTLALALRATAVMLGYRG